MNDDLYATVRALIDADADKARENLSQYLSKKSASIIAATDTRTQSQSTTNHPKLNESVYEIILDGRVLDTITRNENEISNENDIKTMLVMQHGYDPDISVRLVQGDK